MRLFIEVGFAPEGRRMSRDMHQEGGEGNVVSLNQWKEKQMNTAWRMDGARESESVRLIDSLYRYVQFLLSHPGTRASKILLLKGLLTEVATLLETLEQERLASNAKGTRVYFVAKKQEQENHEAPAQGTETNGQPQGEENILFYNLWKQAYSILSGPTGYHKQVSALTKAVQDTLISLQDLQTELALDDWRYCVHL